MLLKVQGQVNSSITITHDVRNHQLMNAEFLGVLEE